MNHHDFITGQEKRFLTRKSCLQVQNFHTNRCHGNHGITWSIQHDLIALIDKFFGKYSLSVNVLYKRVVLDCNEGLKFVDMSFCLLIIPFVRDLVQRLFSRSEMALVSQVDVDNVINLNKYLNCLLYTSDAADE